jgi:hypothetical protein
VIVVLANFALAWGKLDFSLDCGENRRFVIFFSDESVSPRKQNPKAAILAAIQSSLSTGFCSPKGCDLSGVAVEMPSVAT